MKCIKSKVADKIREILFERMDENRIVRLNTKEVHRLIECGSGSCSSDRYIRALRQNGEISYIDPRKNKGIYEIKINDSLIEKIKNCNK